jgi:RHH-type proline utilization regulon transcriptional repressor/proline dehydrogenase/delta 1-pyrroline-5-carboxylate dehydrogenase
MTNKETEGKTITLYTDLIQLYQTSSKNLFRALHAKIVSMERDDLEEKVRNTGSGIYASVKGVPPVFDTGRWLGRIMEWAMKNDDFRTALFHFIDVLPALKTDDLVVRLLNDYFTGADVPRLISGGIERIARKGFLPHVTVRVIRKSVESIAAQFIAGREPEGALEALEALRDEGACFSIDLLGEVVVSDKEAAAYAGRYLALLDFLYRRFAQEDSKILCRPDISVKVSSFYSQLDPADWEGSIKGAKEGLRPVLRKAKALGISVTFDMEQYYYKGLTIAVFKGLLEEEEFRDLPAAGIAIQAYLKDTEEDLSGLVKWARETKRRITIRLVKGAYWDYEVVVNRRNGWPVPVFLRKEETDLNFERLTKVLFENVAHIRPAIATHNLRSMSYASVLADSFGAPADSFEFQMLYGMAEPLRKALCDRGVLLRVYTPVGNLIPGMAYLVRRLLENTSNESFLRKSFTEKTSFEDLIRAPRVPEETDITPPPGHFANEPLTDFSKAPNREKMTDALNSARQSNNRGYPLLIGGREIITGRDIASLNPARPEQVIGRVSSASAKEAAAAIEAAIKMREAWGETPAEERASYLFAAAKEMRKRRFELAALEVCEVGKTWRDADGDIAEAIDYLEYYGREMLRLAPRLLGNYPGEENEYFYRPKGIGAVIAPWNFPLAIATGMTSAALVTGNCVIFKPSGLSPVTGYRLVEIFGLSGLPPGVLQFLPGPGNETGEYLVSHPDIDFIAFTGSKDVGLRIVKLAGETRNLQRNVKRVIAEMGGKNAIIVDETADLDEAVKGILESALGYQGQKCSACSRVIVVGAIFADFSARLKEAVASIKIGPPEDPGNFMGPVIDEAARKKIEAYIGTGKKEGNVLLARETRLDGCFVGPVIFTDLDPASRLATEEIFGPVIVILRAADIEEAIRMANNTSYALTGGLFSRSPSTIARARNDLRVGNLYINRKITGALVARQPFGGFGMSGVGSKAGGPDYLLQFLNPVCVSENTLRRGFAPFIGGQQRLHNPRKYTA